MVTSDFLATGNAGLYMLPLVPEDKKMRTSTSGMDAAVRYIERNSPIGDPIDGRWARDDTSELDPALVEAMKDMEPLSAPEPESGGAYQ